MLVKMTCPGCGQALDFDDSKEFMFCRYCGTKIANVAQKVEIDQNISGTVMHKIDRSGEPNLSVSYSSINMGVRMVLVIDRAQKQIFIHGQSMTYHLSPGPHNLIIKIGKKNYARSIFITEDNAMVSIMTSYTGRGNIAIDQPPYVAPMNPAPTVTPKDVPPVSPMAITAFVLSFFGITSPVALILGIVAIILHHGKKRIGLAIAAIAISSVIILIITSSLANRL